MAFQLPKRHRLIVDCKAQFPEKLYDVANDGYLIHWNSNGSVSVSNEDEFEQTVMKLYPGFLQIPSFANFKRLFREYDFRREYNERNELEFSHHMFIRGRRDLLCEIKTRRKSLRAPRYSQFQDGIIPTEHGRRYSRRRRIKVKYNAGNMSPTTSDSSTVASDIVLANRSANNNNNNNNSSSSNNADINAVSSYLEPNGVTTGSEIVAQNVATKVVNIQDQKYVIDIINDYADNEFDEEEYTKWLTEQRKKDEMKAVAENTDVNNTQEFWWMYSDKNEQVQSGQSSTENNSVPTLQAATPTPKTNETCMPCGFCKCCSAISNYVHIFGEVPENIQVFDFLQEVPEESS